MPKQDVNFRVLLYAVFHAFFKPEIHFHGILELADYIEIYHKLSLSFVISEAQRPTKSVLANKKIFDSIVSEHHACSQKINGTMVLKLSYAVSLILILLFFKSDAKGQADFELDQSTRFDKLTVQDGLSSKDITQIHQDKLGFMWIGTQNGLNLYDGVDFTIFRKELDNQHSLPDNFIYKIFEGPDSVLWVCSAYGLSRFNRNTEDFTNFFPDSIDYYNPVNQIREIHQIADYIFVNAGGEAYTFHIPSEVFQELNISLLPTTDEDAEWSTEWSMMRSDENGNMWFLARENALFVLKSYDSISNNIKTYQCKGSAISSNGLNVSDFYISHGKHIWLATVGNGLYKLTIDDGAYDTDQYTWDSEKRVIGNYCLKIFEDSKSNVWIGGVYGFFKLTADGSDFHAIDDSTGCVIMNGFGVRGFSEDVDGSFWLTSRGGVFRYDFEEHRFTYYKHDPMIESTVVGYHTFQTFIDNTGQIWIPTQNNGISRLNKSENSFLRNQNSQQLNSLSHDWVSSFLVDKNENLWVGTFGGGINRTSYQENHKFKHFKNYLDAGNKSGINNFYANYFVTTLYEDRAGEIWAGTLQGLFYYDSISDDFILYRGEVNDLKDLDDENVTSLFEDHMGTFWVGTIQNLYILDRDTKRYYPMAQDFDMAASKGLGNVSVIYEDHDSALWFGGKYLKKYVRQDSTFISYRPDAEIPNSISDENIWTLLEDEDENFWIGTNEGLIKMNREEELFSSITIEDNQHGNAIHGMVDDQEGNLWMSTINGGVFKYDPKSGSCRNYTMSDGLVDNEYTKNGAYIDDSGWMYFGSYNGFSVFHPDSIQDNRVIPPVFIDAFYIFDEKQHYNEPIFSQREILLDYDQNEFRFHFVALNYLNASQNQYAYMLEGYDEDWNYSGTQRFANYTNMGPGDYVFKVKASNNDGYWNEEGAQIAVVIAPPFWKTIWAYGLYLIGFVLALAAIRHYEMGRLRLKQNLELNRIESEKLTELDKEKSKFFSNISHEFRTPLTLIVGPLDRIIEKSNSEQKEELNLVRRNARRLHALINQLLSISKLEAGKMKLHARPENVVSLTSVLVHSFESMAEHKQISLTFESEQDEYILFLDKMKYEKICINILSNAFKFTPQGGEIKVTIKSARSGENGNPDKLQILFKDSGIGIAKDKLPHVFDRFYQADEAQLQDNLGTGIGLSLSKELVELHHGSISVESESGAGTTFSISLPIGRAHLSDSEINHQGMNTVFGEDEMVDEVYHHMVTAADGASSLPVNKEYDCSTPLILIVDDNDDMRTYIKSYLSDTYQTIEARNGKQGMERALEHMPDLIVSDLMMPILNGNEMTAQLKTDERTSHIPVILLTAKATRESKLEGLETGADDFLTKPFDADELQVRIKNLIAQRRKLREILSQHIGDPSQTRLIRESSGKMMTKVDEQFIEKATNMIAEQMSNPELSVEMFALEMAMSRMQLHRKMTSLTGSSASDLIRDLRLKRAAQLLREGDLNVTEVSYEIGISSLSNFAKIFKKKFGESPSKYAQSHRGK